MPQAHALARPAAMMVRPLSPGGRATQFWLTATASPALSRAPTRLKRAASRTATVGVRARVRTARATEVDTSRKPLRKENAAVRSTTRAKMNSVTSGFLDDDAAHQGGDPAHVLGDVHQLVGDVPVAGILGRLHVLEHVRDPDAVRAFGSLGQAQDLDPVVLKVVQVVQPAHGVSRQLG